MKMVSIYDIIVESFEGKSPFFYKLKTKEYI